MEVCEVDPIREESAIGEELAGEVDDAVWGKDELGAIIDELPGETLPGEVDGVDRGNNGLRVIVDEFFNVVLFLKLGEADITELAEVELANTDEIIPLYVLPGYS